jgi:hypothetical protein
MMPVAFGNSILAIAGSNDYYVGGQSGLLHYGADKNWVKVLSGSISQVFARSPNDVFAVSGTALYRYQADSGWTKLAVPFPFIGNVVSLAGSSTTHLAAISNQNEYAVSSDNGVNWAAMPGIAGVALAMDQTDTVYIARQDGQLETHVLNGAQQTVAAAPALPAGVVWKSLAVVGKNKVYLASTDGQIYLFDGVDLKLNAVLPSVMIDGNQVQQMAVSMQWAADHVKILTQSGGYYTLSPNSLDEILAPGTLQVALAQSHSSGISVAMDKFNRPYQLEAAGWKNIQPSADEDAAMTGFTQWPMSSSRASVNGIYLLNVESKDAAGHICYLQHIDADGHRKTVPISAEKILDVGLSNSSTGEVLILSVSNLYKYDGTTAASVMSSTIPNTGGQKMTALLVTNAQEFYVTTNQEIFKTNDGGQTFTQVTKNGKAVGYRVMFGLSDGSLIAGTDAGDMHIVDPTTGALLANQNLQAPILRIHGRGNFIFTTTSTGLFNLDPATLKWNIQGLPAAPLKAMSDLYVSDTDAWISAGPEGILHWDGQQYSFTKVTNTTNIVTVTPLGQAFYFGDLNGNGGLNLYRNGPMQ